MAFTLAWLTIAPTLLVLFFLAKFLLRRRPERPVPSGPPGHWLLGNLTTPTETIAKTMFEAREKYGPIYEMRLLPGIPLFIVINDAKMARDFLSERDFAGRDETDSGIMRVLNPDLTGIAGQTWSPVWKELHKFTLSSLSALGFGRVQMEDKVVAEADAFVDAVLATNGAAFEPAPFLRIAISNVIANLVFSRRWEIGVESPVHDNMKTLTDGFLYIMLNPFYNFLPVTMKLFPTKRLKEIMKATKDLKAFIDESVAAHEASIDPDDPRDFIDAIVIERRRRPGAEHLNDSNVRQNILDLFNGGTDTTSSALNWAIAWQLKHPEIRNKLMVEIDEIIGPDGTPSLPLIHKCHYLQAFVDEVLRRSTVADFPLPHKALKPIVRFAGYDITDSQLTAPNIWGIHHDPALWRDPMTFDPDRFLDEDGKYVRNENLMAFGHAYRRCVGEKLAKLEIYIFVVRMLQRVEFRLAQGCAMPALDGRKPLLRVPEFYEVTAKAML